MTKVVDQTNVSFIHLLLLFYFKNCHLLFCIPDVSLCVVGQGHRVYYHRIVVESESLEKESIVVKCGWMPHHPERHRAKRQGELSPDFQEDE
jgi:hypothetical protein